MERTLAVITLLISTLAVGRIFSDPSQSSGISPQEHWALHSAIAVWIDRQNLPPQGDQLVEKAMRTWATASSGAFTMRRTFLATDAGIKIYFNGAGGNYGETRPHITAAGLIDAAEVNIAADAPIEVEPLTRDIIVYLTALHELGHALGLEHTRNFDDIMYLFRQPGDGPRYFGNYRKLLKTADDIGGAAATGLSASDVQTLRELYR